MVVDIVADLNLLIANIEAAILVVQADVGEQCVCLPCCPFPGMENGTSYFTVMTDPFSVSSTGTGSSLSSVGTGSSTGTTTSDGTGSSESTSSGSSMGTGSSTGTSGTGTSTMDP